MFRLRWLLLKVLLILVLRLAFEQSSTHRADSHKLDEKDPLSYALAYVRKTESQFHVGDIAVHYAELGYFEKATMIGASCSSERWRAITLSKIALEYWKHGKKDAARELFLQVANTPLPKDIFAWDSVTEDMAEAEQFDLALDNADRMSAVGGGLIENALDKIVEAFIRASVTNRGLQDVLPRVLTIAKTMKAADQQANVIKKVAVAYTARGEFDSATKLVKERLTEDYDKEDCARDLAIELARLGQYDRALPLVRKAGAYFGAIAYVEIVTEALRKGDRAKALEILTMADSLLTKTVRTKNYEADYTQAARLSEFAILYSQLERRTRAIELTDVAFQIAKRVRRPYDKNGALQAVANAYAELNLYDQAIEAATSHEFKHLHKDLLAEIGVRAQTRGRLEAVAKIVKVIQTAPLTEVARLSALVSVARAGAEQGRLADARELLHSSASVANRLEGTDDTPQVLRKFSLAFAEAGDLRAALKWISRVEEPFHSNEALIDIAMVALQKGLTLDVEDQKLLDKIVSTVPPTD
jgi:tetratricopeptide (TPR) repeat protein